jgi:hypothetical protein
VVAVVVVIAVMSRATKYIGKVSSEAAVVKWPSGLTSKYPYIAILIIHSKGSIVAVVDSSSSSNSNSRDE